MIILEITMACLNNYDGDIHNSIFFYMSGAIMTESVIWSSYIDGATFSHCLMLLH